MATLNAFDSSAFSMTELTNAVNIRGNIWGRLNEMGLFRDRGVRTDTVYVDRKTQSLKILPSAPRGAPATKNGVRTREAIPLAIKHFYMEDRILAADVQGIRAFGSDSEMESLMDVVNERTEDMNQSLDITLEYMKWGLLNEGIVYDGDANELLDLFTTMGVTQESQAIALSSDDTEIETSIADLKRYFEANSRGLPIAGIHVFMSDGYWDAFKVHPKVAALYQYYQTNNQNPAGDYRNLFRAWGVTFENVSGSWTTNAGSTVYQVATDEAVAIPVGTDIFQTFYAPAGYEETVNTPGLPRYAKIASDAKWNEYRDVRVETHPLVFCERPDMIVQLTKT